MVWPRDHSNLKTVSAVLVYIGMCAGGVLADTVHLTDGSKIVGSIGRLANGKLTIQTEFTGKLTVDRKKVRGISSERKLVVALDSGDRVTGKLRFDPEKGQTLTGTAFGDVTLKDATIVGVWPPDRPAPPVEEKKEEISEIEQEHEKKVKKIKAEHQRTIAEIEEEHQKRLTKLQKKQEKLAAPWSARIEVGLHGETGNTERINVRGRGEANRETPTDRLNLFIEGAFSEEDGRETQNEIFGGSKLEVDITDRFFVFGKVRLERDEFERLDLRADVTGGVGYFLLREAHQEFKIRGGAGFQSESFDTGVTNEELILEAGYDYRLDLFEDWLRFTHSLTYIPTIEAIADDFRIDSETAIEIPLTEDAAWKLRTGMRNEFDNNPQPGVERLDTSYFMDALYEWD